MGSINGREGREFSNIKELSEYVVVFSDDGNYLESKDLTREAMIQVRKLGKSIVFHCEDEILGDGGYIHDEEYAKEHGHKGLFSASEHETVARDIRLAKETGGDFNICHIPSKESVELVRVAKKREKITCEVASHHVVPDEKMIKEDGIYKMYPPI